MDLTKHYPRSVREPFAGVVQIGRTIDKARAHVAGTVGEYHYNCPMDRAVFAFLGVEDAESLFPDVRAEPRRSAEHLLIEDAAPDTA